MENNFILVDGVLINVDTIRQLGPLQEYSNGFFFRLRYKNCAESVDFEFNFVDYDIETDEAKAPMRTKLENEHARLVTHLLEHNATSKKFFVKIDLRKNAGSN